MRQWTHALVVAAMIAGCQQGSTSDPESTRPAATTPYGRDVERICYCQEHSGALERPEAERTLIVARWLGANLESDQGRDFLAEVSRSSPADKVVLLDREALSAGLPGCPLARTWAQGLPASR